MGTSEIIQLATLVGTLITVVSIVWKLSRDISNKQEELKSSIEKFVKDEIGKLWARIDDVAEESESKRGKIYSRIDDGDRRTAAEFVRCDMCKVLHGALKEATKDIGSDVKRLLERAGVDNG